MKVDGPGKSSGTKGVSRTGGKKATGDASFSGMVDDAEETAGKKGVSGVMNVSQLDALLSLQETGGGDSEEARKRAKQRANLLLDHLDQIRVGILTGGVPVVALQQLTRLMGQHREKIMDPRLAEVLDEIDLRVQVELAKHSQNR